MRFAEFELDTRHRRLTRRRDGRVVRLQPMGYALLVHLLDARDRAISRRELEERLWPGVFVSEHALPAAVKRLRASFVGAGGRGDLIETVRAFGYRVGVPVEVSPDPPAPGPLAPGARGGLPRDEIRAMLFRIRDDVERALRLLERERAAPVARLRSAPLGKDQQAFS
jgi:DNA-binding winged helix-turn-helix (wHTH) protein